MTQSHDNKNKEVSNVLPWQQLFPEEAIARSPTVLT